MLIVKKITMNDASVFVNKSERGVVFLVFK